VNQRKPPEIILASTSSYRADLLARLHIEFEQIDSLYEEFELPDESPETKAIRLARGKASHLISHSRPKGRFIVIGSDQVAHLNKMTFSKPITLDAATSQLSACSGQWVSFTTAICLIDESGLSFEAVECFQIKYRSLSVDAIAEYLAIDEPFDCAGSIKLEASGITLIEDTRGRDINTLYGLPLMLLQETLRSQFNYPV
jgi:MAF protein